MTIGVPVLAFVVLAVQGSAANGRISGRVIDASSGAPISGVHVTLMMVIDLPNGATIARPPRESTTDAAGAFGFDRVEPGQYTVQAEKTGFASYPDVFGGDPPERLTVDGKTQVPPVSVALNKGAVMTGKIVNAAGEPQEDLEVSALRRTDKAGLPEFVPNGQAQTNDLGEFRIAGLAAGDYIVMASTRPRGPFGAVPSDAATTVAPTYFPGTLDQHAARVTTLTPGQAAAGVEFSILKVKAFHVSGVVVDPAGRPSPGAIVMLMPDWPTSGAFTPIEAMAADDGTFVIGNVIAGSYSILAEPNAGGGGAMGAIMFSSETSSDSSKPGTSVTVTSSDIKGLKVIAKER